MDVKIMTIFDCVDRPKICNKISFSKHKVYQYFYIVLSSKILICIYKLIVI